MTDRITKMYKHQQMSSELKLKASTSADINTES